MNTKLYVAPSAIHGQGLFAARPLKTGQLIGYYEGPMVEDDGTHVLWVEDENESGWTGFDGVNEMRYMNHADKPTAEMDGLYCYALVDMETDTEVTIDYGWNDS